jgi:sugar lactone lactonase YvrE
VSDAATLTIESITAPLVTAQPLSRSVLAGDSVTFTASASGSPTLTYQWRKDGVTLANGGRVSGATTTTLTISGAATEDNGSYTLVVTNGAGSATSGSATLTVTNPPPPAPPQSTAVAPTLSRQPASQSVAAGAGVVFTVEASGSPAPAYQWRRNGVALANGGNVSGATSSALTLGAAGSADAGTYTVEVSNSAGAVTSSGATLTVTDPAVAPTITTQPASRTVAEGSNVTLNVTASGTPAPTVQWYRNGVALFNLGNVSGASSATLTVTAVSSADVGTYTAVATNSAGAATSQGATLALETPSPSPSPSPSPAPSPAPAPAPAPSPSPAPSPAPAPSALLPFPVAVAVTPNGAVYVSDASLDQVFLLEADGRLRVVAGAAGTVGSTDGTGTAARFNDPSGLAPAGGSGVLVADRANALIRWVESGGRVSTVAGSASFRGAADGAALSATFSSPAGVVRDAAGTVYVTDAMMHTVRRIATNGEVTTFAGTPGEPGDADGTGRQARFNQPAGLAVDAAGHVYVADAGNNLIRKISPEGVVTTLAGIFGVSGARDGTASDALFNQPTGVAVDGAGNVYIADMGNSVIRKLTPGGEVSTLAGLSGVAGLRDGQGGGAWMSQPRSIAYDGANSLYVADTGNAAIRRVTLTGAVSTVTLVSAPSVSEPEAPAVAPSPTPAPPSAPSGTPSAPSSGGGGGGGGSNGLLVILALGALLAARRALRAR